MNESPSGVSSRREFLHSSGRIAATSALAAMSVPRVHAAEDNTIRVALIGCGGRGHRRGRQRASVQNGPVKLVAMADGLREPTQGQPQASGRAIG